MLNSQSFTVPQSVITFDNNKLHIKKKELYNIS